MSPRESVVLCEGFHDRAFWDGWLRHLGCAVPEDPSKPLTTKVVKDPWGMRVAGGQFGYHSPTKAFIRLTPCGGEDKVRDELKSRLQGRATKLLHRLVVTYDADADARSEPDVGLRIQSIHDSVRSLIKGVDPGFTTSAAGDYLLDGGGTLVSVVVWCAPDAHGPGLPWKHTLERLACAALNAAFPGRAQSVEEWLQGRPGGPVVGPKEYAWSHMAGWYAEKGCEAFYSDLWKERAVAQQLESRLTRLGAWRIAQEVAA